MQGWIDGDQAPASPKTLKIQVYIGSLCDGVENGHEKGMKRCWRMIFLYTLCTCRKKSNKIQLLCELNQGNPPSKIVRQTLEVREGIGTCFFFFSYTRALCGIPELSGHRYNTSVHTSTHTIMSPRYIESPLIRRACLCLLLPARHHGGKALRRPRKVSVRTCRSAPSKPLRGYRWGVSVAV